MFARILAGGYQIVYTPAAVNRHTHRRSQKELISAIYGYGVGTYAYWTQKLLEEGEWGVFWLALQWAFHDQIPNLIKSFLPFPDRLPIAIPLAEIRGCLAGPFAYLKSKSLLETHQVNENEYDPELSSGQHSYSHT